MNDEKATQATFSALRELGIRLTLDDFGTGYSSLAYLRRTPFDRLKIDRTFVAGSVGSESRNVAIIRAIVALASSSGMDVTAEGIESERELSLVTELGCTHAQGFLFGRPLEPDQVMTLIEKSLSQT